MDKALASGAKDCGFKSHQGRIVNFFPQFLSIPSLSKYICEEKLCLCNLCQFLPSFLPATPPQPAVRSTSPTRNYHLIGPILR